MRTDETRAIEAPLSELERALIEEFLRAHGRDPRKLEDMSERDREALLRDASTYASDRLTEVESRSHYVHEIHNDTAFSKKRL